ncbi:MAG: GDP-mannose 4,6-dehydratase [Opitutales bacterium]|nr:GDP-mannose 4,6-dehydratase [Opitutales bacterium]
MKFLVTGAAGFIASRTAEMLLEQGHEVVSVDNVNDYYDVRLKTFRLHRTAAANGADAELLAALDFRTKSAAKYPGPGTFSSGRYSFIRADIENKPLLDVIFSEHKFDVVVNLAARAGVRYSMENPGVYMTTNAIGTLNLLDCMKEHGVKKMVLASTSSLYAGQPMPFVETLPVNTPISPYAASKKAAEVMAYSYHFLYGLDVSVVRYFTVFGPAGRPDMSIFRFIKWIDEGVPIELFGDGSQARDFTYVDDIARGTIAAIKPVGYEVINLGGGNNPLTLNTIIGWIEELLDKEANYDRKPFHKADIKETWADISKAGRLLNWEPNVTPREGLELSVKWYSQNRDWLDSIKL